jgi:hypothetical protein
MSIEKHTGDFVGNLTDLYLIPSTYIETIPDPDSNFELDFTDFELKSGKNFEKIYFSPQTGNFSENENQEDPGKIYSKSIGFRIPKNRSAVTAWLRGKRNMMFSALIRMADGTYFFVERNMVITGLRTIPEGSEKYNGYEITISGDHDEPSPAVNNVSL